MTQELLSFKTNVGLKDLVGRGLIFDDNIAIIELIKNSKDADSKTVHIDFVENKDQLIISDEGCGMTLDDIINKWLNIAYSEKKSKKEKDKQYAGNKGIGRFSCDRLGKSLTLYTKAEKGEYLKVHIDWTRFEIDNIDADISSIEFKHEVLSRKDFFAETESPQNFKTGSILAIEKLRSSWTKKKFDKLQSELEKFVAAPDQDFQVYLSIPGNDKQLITNNVFEDLKYRTYYIESSIDTSGKTIKTTLYYNREVLYTFTCENPYPHLKSIKTLVYYLSFTSKGFFKRSTKITSSDYGSVFLFLNGFRVSPYGNPKNDWLGLDQRKTQGVSRYFGTREVIGRVELTDNNDEFHPLTSREGLVENEAFRELVAHEHHNKVRLSNGKTEYGFIPHVIRQLEKVVVGGLNWHSIIDLEPTSDVPKVISDSDLRKDPTRYAVKQINPTEVEAIIEKLINSPNFKVMSFKVNKPLISQLSKEAEDAYNEYILTFIENTTDKSFDDFNPKEKGDIKKIAADNMRLLQERKSEAKKLVEAERRAAEAKRMAKEANARATKAENNLKTSEKQRLFAQSQVSSSTTKLQEVIHLTGHWGQRTQWLISEALKNLDTDPDQAKARLRSAQMLAGKTAKLSKIISKANFALMTDSSQMNIFEYISEYLAELKELGPYITSLQITYDNPKNTALTLNMSALEVSMLIDNIALNAESHKAKKLTITATETKNKIQLVFHNDGQALTTEYPPEDLFKAGITTTTGSGMGLYQAKEIATNLDAAITIQNNKDAGVDIIMEWEK